MTVVVAVGVLAAIGIGAVAWLLRDAPRPFDADELDPIIAGTVVVEPPVESCGQGREPAGDCDAGAEVRSRDGTPVVDVIAANAEAAGFAAVDPGGAACTGPSWARGASRSTRRGRRPTPSPST